MLEEIIAAEAAADAIRKDPTFLLYDALLGATLLAGAVALVFF